MIPLALVLVPLLLCVCLISRTVREDAVTILLLGGFFESSLAIFEAITTPVEVILGGLLRVDHTAQLLLAVINPIFLGISVYVWSRVFSVPRLREDMPRFVSLALLFLSFSNAVLLSNHLLLSWIALESTSLAITPLIARRGLRSSVQASWRYLLFSSVGLGLVLLGFLCLARGAVLGGQEMTFLISEPAPLVSAPWGRLGLALVLLGIGTKLGLAPMYSWLPETYDEAPPAVAALLGAVQFNCALVVLFRVVQLFRAEEPQLITNMLLTMGLASMAVSTANITSTRNMKRLIAYASINHAGVIAIGLGVGASASYGLLLYVLSNAFIKAILFITAGTIKAQYKTKDTRQISGLIKYMPYSGLFLMVGTFALLGFPPFGSFIGELLILSALVSSQKIMVFAAFGALITITFIATGRTIFPMIWGEPKENLREQTRQTFLSASPKMFFFVALVVLGVYVPPVINQLIQQVAASLEGK